MSSATTNARVWCFQKMGDPHYLKIRVDGAVHVIVHHPHVCGNPLHELCKPPRGDARIESDFCEIFIPELPHSREHVHIRHSCVIVSSKPREKELKDALHGVELVWKHATALLLLVAGQEQVVKCGVLEL